MLLDNEPPQQIEEKNTVSTGKLVFCAMITIATAGATYILVQKYEKEKKK